MSTSVRHHSVPALSVSGRFVGPLGTSLAALVAAVLVAKLGPWALLLPVYVGALTAAIIRPTHTALGLLVVAIALEPNAIDLTRWLSAAVYQMPPGWEQALGLTTSPIEVVTIAVAISVTLQRAGSRTMSPLPLVAWMVPAAIGAGLAYGLYRGAPANLAYTELRGLITGLAIFVIAWRCGYEHLGLIVKATGVSVALLAGITISRYLVYVKLGQTSTPIEAVFAHEGSVIMGVGLVVAVASLLRARDAKAVILLVLYSLLLLVAMIMTGRRGATLVILVAGLSMGCFSLMRRPALTVAVAAPILLAFGAYLGAYWNREYGATAQPARAVRSQFDPNPRDDSSDTYRLIEKANVIETLRVNRAFGVGFGRPFIQFQPLPDLSSFWSMQSFTPHQSVLWLWLKTGWLGISVFLGFVVVLLRRCLEAQREFHRDSQTWTIAAALFTVIVMFVVYSTVDVSFASGRQLAPIAVAAGLALQLKPSRPVASND